MEMDKIVNLGNEELALQARQAAEQIFRLRFQLAMGQQEGVKKFRELKKDIARIKTAQRQRELGIVPSSTSAQASEAKPIRAAKKTVKSKAKTAKAKSGRTSKSAKKSVKRTAKTASKAKSASRAVKSAKRGKANAKKGGS